MSDDIRGVLWYGSIHGNADAGFVRVHVFIEPDSGAVRTEVEYCTALGRDWSPLPPVA